MSIKYIIYSLLSCIGFIAQINLCTAQSTILINEIMAKNEQTILDIDGDPSDWIELFNSSENTIELENFSLADDGQEWFLPAMTMQPNSYIVVFASKKDKIENGQLHTNFKLDSGGEFVILRDQNKNIIDQINFPALEENVSYGRATTHSNWIKYKPATPGSVNEGVAFVPLGQITSSHEDGFYAEPISIQLSNFDTTHTVYYTLDGTIPTQESMLYQISSFIYIDDTHTDETIAFIPTSDEWEMPDSNMPAAQILRAVVYKNGLPQGEVLTQNFWIGEEAIRQQLPVISIVGEEASFFDEQKGIYVKGVNDNYWQKGKDWERPVSVNFYDEFGKLLLNQDAGIRLGGAKTRIEPQKTLRLYARDEYGESTFGYPFWGADYGRDTKRITLRTLNVGPWSKAGIMDDLIHEIINGELDLDYVRRKFSVVYINGVYWGIHSMREHNNQHFIERKYGVSDDDVVVAKASVNVPEVWNKFDTLVAEIANLDLRNQADYDYVAANLDIPQYTNYIITNLAFANRDWPANNTEYWYSNAYDGKIRFIMNDLDASMLVHNDERLELYITEQAERLERDKWGRVLVFMQKLLENPKYRQYFNQRITALLNTTFSPDRTVAILDDMVTSVRPEMATHIDRWHFPNKIAKWDKAIERLRQFLIRRPLFLLEQSKELFGTTIQVLPNPVVNELTIKIDPWQDCTVLIRLVDLSGNEVQVRSMEVSEGLQSVKVDTNTLAEGMYILNVSYLGINSTEKFVKLNE